MFDRLSLRILIVEDDVDTRANLQDILELDGHSAKTAGSVADLFEPRDWSDVDVLILDRKLPDGDAEAMLPRIAGIAPDAAVIVVTGYSDVEGAVTALRRGASDYLLKPINPDALRASLHRIAEARKSAYELKARAEQQTIVAEIGQQALRSNDLPKLMQEIVGRVATTLKVELCKVLELLPPGDRLILRAGFGWNPSLVGSATVPNDPDCQAGYTLRQNEPVVLEELQKETRFSGPSLLHEHGVVSGMSVVIDGMAGPFGVLGAHTTRQRRFTPADVAFLQSIANVLAAFISRSESEQRARQAERLAAIGEMVTGLAHESRNALQRSQACLEMLSLHVEDRPEAVELVSRIQRAQDYLHHLYEEVRGYAAPLSIRRAAVDLASIWRETWLNLEHSRRGRQVTLAESLPCEPPTLAVDRHALEQVFRNIFENAIAACADPAEVTVTVREARTEAESAVQIRIGDNGPGLTAEQRGRLFEPFFTTKTHGTGLGMAITRRIVEAHGGRIEIGDPEQGAELIITLPGNQVLA